MAFDAEGSDGAEESRLERTVISGDMICVQSAPIKTSRLNAGCGGKVPLRSSFDLL